MLILRNYFGLVLLIALCGISNLSFSKRSNVTNNIEALELKVKDRPNDIDLKFKLFDAYLQADVNPEFEKELIAMIRSTSTSKSHRAKAYLLLSRTKKSQQDAKAALNFNLKAERAFTELKDSEGFVESQVQLIEFYRWLGEYDKAEKYYYRALQVVNRDKINNPKILNRLYHRFAAVLNETSRRMTSLKYSLKAIEIASKLNDFDALATSYNEMGYTYKNLENVQKSLENYELAEKMWMKIGNHVAAANVRLNILEIKIHNELISASKKIEELNHLEVFIDSLQVSDFKLRILQMKRTYYHHTFQWEKAFFAEQKYQEQKFNELNKRNTAEINKISAAFNNERLAKENSLILSEKRKKESQLFWAVILGVFIAVTLLIVFMLWQKLKKSYNVLKIKEQQKSILIQEVHHRVKNNLQFVKSMIEMQMSEDENLKSNSGDGLRDVSARIDAMSLVHEMLYVEKDQFGVNVNHYLQRLMDSVAVLFESQKKVQFHIDVPTDEIQIDRAVSIGIICAELFNNSVKHAFRGKLNAEFTIVLSLNNDFYELNIFDNGGQIKFSHEQVEQVSLGMRIIDMFSRQLKGKYTINKEKGYHYCLSFPK